MKRYALDAFRPAHITRTHPHFTVVQLVGHAAFRHLSQVKRTFMGVMPRLGMVSIMHPAQSLAIEGAQQMSD